ncbi:two-component system sensor histidine kinase NtrB [Desulfohalovibrio reitneri]|uniref:two-component system sensor histidine kinase NtrB n=1 Tax=Desulfohalovibrio reitneri TaxID=1307759 RepID=UPI00068FF09E|nr:PAS domain-containing sensor histidine kinase [Desulfohalovibrio reitneri]
MTDPDFESLSREELLRRARILASMLAECQDQHRALADSSVDAMITTDANGLVLSWNPAAERLFGWQENEAVGRDVEMIIPQRLRQAHHEGMRRFMKTGRKRLIGNRTELDALNREGREFPIELSLSTWTSRGERFFGAIIRDVTIRKRHERLREDVQRIARHDLKSPLAGVGGLARLLSRSENLSDKEREWAREITRLSERMLGSIQRSMDFLRMEEGTYELKPENLDLADMLDGLHREFQSTAQDFQVNLVYRVNDEEIPPDNLRQTGFPHRGEADLLHRMLENLLKNAIEATPAGETVTLDLRRETGKTVITIHNPGTIPREIRDRLFEPYVSHGKKTGTGLGTTSARLIARIHGGDITFTSTEDQGTTLRVELPG